ncbi:helix-turn-helix domain-containing protein [Ideonella sp.]|uniref:helix-turn-helix domain-containing protein n=1 Tax=Ideonella sp. TaxID=1929293 RepID=UPI002B48610A|nr:helix-turn-helix domain-containing protein [Ideonella sp.]HJV71691.1 helix-turn-helix domain-containing protein [Ideonella sp.]
MNLSIEQFGDIHLHAASVRDWSQTYCQLTRGSLQTSLLQLSGQRFQIFRELINQRVVQNGEAPSGRICFAVPLAVPGTARVQGREADESSFFVLQGGEEFMFHMPTGMDLLSITFDQRAFEQAVGSASRPEQVQVLLKQPVLRIPAARLGDSRRRLLGLFEQAVISAGALDAETEAWLEGALMSELVDLLAAPECDMRQRHGSSPGSYIVEKCHRLTVDDRLNPPSVGDLCKRLRVSRRSVQNGFRSVTETTPINYLRCVRLNGVRRELMSTRGGDVSIGDAAAQWGFFHLSHFAADYQELFGELPSQTRRADGATGRPTGKASALV